MNKQTYSSSLSSMPLMSQVGEIEQATGSPKQKKRDSIKVTRKPRDNRNINPIGSPQSMRTQQSSEQVMHLPSHESVYDDIQVLHYERM